MREADLSGTNLLESNFEKSNMQGVNFYGANLQHSNLRYANLMGADFINANVRAVNINRKTKFLGARLGNCYGSPRFISFGRHQEFLEEMRQTRIGRFWYRVWLVSADCGRTPYYWILWMIAFALGFAYAFRCLNQISPAFDFPEGLGNNFYTMLYYSVVTFTTLGFGDITPITHEASFLVMAEVIIGYVMLGGLLTIFATLIARRF